METGDRDALESQIDFPSVRESLKEQLHVHIARSIAQDKDLKDNAFAGLATAFAPMMVNYAVDNYVTPTGIAAIIADSKAALNKPGSATDVQMQRKALDWRKARYAFFTDPTHFTLDLENSKLRFGFTGWGWQLKRIEIPLQ